MPQRYMAIKASVRKNNPKMSEKEVEKRAAMIYNGSLKKGEKAVGRGS